MGRMWWVHSFAWLWMLSCAVNAFGKAPAKQSDHTEAGPHKGALTELGKEEYHAELVLDEKASTAVVYLLDSTASKSVGISEKEITIALLPNSSLTNHYFV